MHVTHGIESFTTTRRSYDANGNGCLDFKEQRNLFLDISCPPSQQTPVETAPTWAVLPPFDPNWSPAKRNAYMAWNKATFSFQQAHAKYTADRAVFNVYTRQDAALYKINTGDHLDAPPTPDQIPVALAERECVEAKRQFDRIPG